MENIETTKKEKKPRNVVFWVNVTYFCMIAMLMGVQILSKTVLNEQLSGLDLNLVFTIIVQIGIMLIIPLTAFSLIKRQRLKKTLQDFKVNRISFKHIILCFGIGILVFLLNICIAGLFSSILSFLGYESLPATQSGTAIDTGWVSFLLVVLYSAFLPAVCEEITHRGMLLNTYKKFGLTKALILSSVLFGLMHLNINQFFYASIIGFVIGFIAICANSIIPAMIVHFTNNFINTYLEFASANGWAFGDFYSSVNGFVQANPVVVMFVSIVVLSLIVFALFYLIKKLFLERRGQEIDIKIRGVIIKNVLKERPEGLKQEDIVVIEQNVTNAKYHILDLVLNKNSPVALDSFNDKKPERKRATFSENIFFYSAVGMASIMTIFTFIWGVL